LRHRWGSKTDGAGNLEKISEAFAATLARIVLAGREHAVLVEPFGKGMLAVTLRYPNEVSDGASRFRHIEDLSLPKEMREFALHIVDRMAGRFDPSKIEDRYKKALDQPIASKANAHVASCKGRSGKVPARRKPYERAPRQHRR
jgi:non-homologous end joining protein Ku